MKAEFIQRLSCPECANSSLELHAQHRLDREVISGKVLCQGCNHEYPISQGIPFMITDQKVTELGVWDKLYRATNFESVRKQINRNMSLPVDVLEDYYAHARVVNQQEGKVHSILDIGCGSGSYALALWKLAVVGEIVLLDISPPALLSAKALLAERNIPVEAVIGDIHCLPFPRDAFDLSFSGGLIEHFAGEEQERIVHEHCRVAKRALIEAPLSSAAYWLFRSLYTVMKGGWPFGFERPISKKRMRALLEKAGYRSLVWEGHDLASVLELYGARQWAKFPRIHRWPGLARLSRHDLIVWAEPQPGNKGD